MRVVFTDSAMKREFTEEQVAYAVENNDGYVKEFTEPYPPATVRPWLFIGPVSRTDHRRIEVYLNVDPTGVVKVFHVMYAQEENLNLIGRSYR